MAKKYRLRYLPLFEQDFAAVQDYIALKLKNPNAAKLLVEETEAAIKKRLLSPESFQPYPSKRKRAYNYYRIRVKNYFIFYVIIDNIMEVRRFLYSRRNIKDLI